MNNKEFYSKKFLSNCSLFGSETSVTFLSSGVASLIPAPFGKEMKSSCGRPKMKTLDNRVAKVCPVLSLTWTISKDPGWWSRCMTVPTRPKLWPPVIMQTCPGSKQMNCLIFPDSMSTMTELLTLIWVRIRDGASIMGNQEWNSLASGSNLLHFAEFVSSQLRTKVASYHKLDLKPAFNSNTTVSVRSTSSVCEKSLFK